MQWIELDAHGITGSEEWRSAAGIDDAGTVYLAADSYGNGIAMLLFAANDGALIPCMYNRSYVPIDYFIQARPHMERVFRQIERKCRRLKAMS